MQLAKLIKQVQLLTTKNMPNQKICEICGTFGHGANVFSFASDSHAGTKLDIRMIHFLTLRILGGKITLSFMKNKY